MDAEERVIRERQDRYGQYVRRLLLLNIVAWTFTLGSVAYLWGVL
jgi:hypothetical protein